MVGRTWPVCCSKSIQLSVSNSGALALEWRFWKFFGKFMGVFLGVLEIEIQIYDQDGLTHPVYDEIEISSDSKLKRLRIFL